MWVFWTCHTLQKSHYMTDTAYKGDQCPFCESDVTDGITLIEYNVDGERRVFVECPTCEQPVAPS